MKITSEHFEAFYGIIPDKPEMFIQTFRPLVITIYNSICKKYPSVPDKVKEKGLIQGLKFLNKLPEKEIHIILTRFKGDLGLRGATLDAASIEISKYVSIIETKKYIKSSKSTDDTLPITTREIYDEFKNLVSYWTQQGLPDIPALIAAYKDLLKKYTEPKGKLSYDLLCGIPFEYQIFHNTEIISAVNEHPNLPDRKVNSFGNLPKHLPTFRKDKNGN